MAVQRDVAERWQQLGINAGAPPQRHPRKLSFDLLALGAVGFEAAMVTAGGMLAGFLALDPSQHGLLGLAVLLGTMLIGTGLHAAGAYSLDAFSHPAARLGRVGVNIAAVCLAMVVVASLIGAKGLGEDVLEALQYANVGQGILAGFAILFCAMILDRIVQGDRK